MIRGIFLLVAIIALPFGCTDSGTDKTTGATPQADGAVITGSTFSRYTNTRHAICVTPDGKKFRVEVSQSTASALRDGQPCPNGPRKPLPSEEHPELFDELTKDLPYGGGDARTCGEWQTIDKEEARRFAAKCPPVKWGDLK